MSLAVNEIIFFMYNVLVIIERKRARFHLMEVEMEDEVGGWSTTA